jgi:hypothetical protein
MKIDLSANALLALMLITIAVMTVTGIIFGAK